MLSGVQGAVLAWSGSGLFSGPYAAEVDAK